MKSETMKHYQLLKEYYLLHLKSKGYAKKTITNYQASLKVFFEYLMNEEIKNINEVKPEDILNFLVFLKQKKIRESSERKYSTRTIVTIVIALRGFYKKLIKDSYVLSNPLKNLDLDIKYYKKSRDAVSLDEMTKLLESINQKDKISLRDRAIFETLYGTGMRVGELCNLTLEDVDLHQGQIRVREPKNRYERYVPLGKRVLKYVTRYVKEARRKYVLKADKEDQPYFFFSTVSTKLNAPQINKRLRFYIKEAGLKDFTCHVIRHSFATHMLENGAGIKHVKNLLGHRHIGSTVIYTHLDVNSLKKIMKMYHPRENELYEDFKAEDCQPK